MIDLDLILRWVTTTLVLLFFCLWRLSERQENRALGIASQTVQTTHACIASYGASADRMGTAVNNLTNSIRE